MFYAIKNYTITKDINILKDYISRYDNLIFKTFIEYTDALDYMNEEEKEFINVLEAYVDGSCNGKKEINEYSSGIVFISNNEVIDTHCMKGHDESLMSMRNVAGEIEAARYAMEYACNHNVKKLIIYHDYTGIAEWPLGNWKAQKEGTKRYKKYYDSIKDNIEIKFVKVAAHTGNKYNEMADKLAKKGMEL